MSDREKKKVKGKSIGRKNVTKWSCKLKDFVTKNLQ